MGNPFDDIDMSAGDDPAPEAEETTAETAEVEEEPAEEADSTDEEPEESEAEETDEEEAEDSEDSEATEVKDSDEEGKPAKEEEKPEEKKPDEFEVKIDGKESKVSLDELRRGYQIFKAGENRFTEAKKLQEEAQWTIKQFRENPFDTAVQLLTADTKNPRMALESVLDAAVNWAAPYLQEKTLPEDQRRFYEQQRELDYQRRQFESEKQRLEREKAEREDREQQQRLVNDINEAIESSGLQEYRDPARMQREIVGLMKWYIDERGIDITPAEAAAEVKKELDRLGQLAAKRLPPGDLEKANPKAVDEIRKKNIEAAKDKRRTTKGDRASKGSTPNSRRAAKPAEVVTSEFFSQFDA